MDNIITIIDKKRQFKTRDIRTYSSTEWLFDNKKKYRNVFHRNNVNYIYCEFSMYNLKLESSDWDYDFRLECHELGSNGEQNICNIPFKKQASKDENIIFIREGWGNKEMGAFWTKGVYQWKVFIDDELIATKKFYIEDIANVTVNKNPFFNFKSIKLYEDDYNDSTHGNEREYYTDFERHESRYIYCALVLNNLQKEYWYGEFYFNIYLQSGEIKGRIDRLIHCDNGDKEVTVSAGWGSNIKGTWYEGNYIFQIVFFDHIIAEIPFSVGDRFKSGVPNYDLTIINSFSKFDYELVRIPKELKTPFQQYLLFFNDYINLTKNRNVLFDVKQSHNGLVLEYAADDDELPYSKEDFQRYFKEYLSFPSTNSVDWIIDLENDANPNFEILLLKLQNKVKCLEADIKIAQKENSLLLSQNEYLQQITLKLASNKFIDPPIFKKINLSTSDLKENLSKNKVEDVLDFLLKSASENEVYLLKSQWNNLRKSHLTNTISFEVYNRETNKIKLAILDLIDQLDP